tara:strand:+ start:929 stop:1120 length:192 start_codon:yes stop_codon:yes gene_type:complete
MVLTISKNGSIRNTANNELLGFFYKDENLLQILGSGFNFTSQHCDNLDRAFELIMRDKEKVTT